MPISAKNCHNEQRSEDHVFFNKQLTKYFSDSWHQQGYAINRKVYGKAFNSDGTTRKSEFLVSEDASVNNQNPSLAYLGSAEEKIVILWDVETSPKKKVQYRIFKGVPVSSKEKFTH